MSKTPIKRTTIGLIYFGWWVFWMGVQAYAMTRLGFDLDTALTDASITQFILAVAGYTINSSTQAYQPGKRTTIFLIVRSIALACAFAFLQRWVLEQVITGQPEYEIFLINTMIIRGAFAFLMILLVAILTWFGVYVSERSETERRKEDVMKMTREAELTKLRQQLQPHFLFNSLNSISALAGSKPEEARKMIQQLSDFLRGTMKKDEATLVTFEEELNHLQLYLEIEKVRFGHRLNVEIHKSEDSLGLKLPSLLLQPIVENAIKFGLYDTIGEITLSLTARQENNLLMVEVKNPFDPETSLPKQGTGFGLSSVQRRLYLIYFRNDLLVTTQNENQFTTIIKIPQPV